MAMRAALPGMPLEDGVSFGLFDTHVGLAEGVLSLIASFAEFNARQEQAFAACADGFDWPQLGRQLMSGMKQRRVASLLRTPQHRLPHYLSRRCKSCPRSRASKPFGRAQLPSLQWAGRHRPPKPAPIVR